MSGLPRSGARMVYLTAAAVTAAALAVPLWGFAMSAPQYPDETLHLQVTRAGIAGDVQEVETLQHYIGVRFPTDLPELTWAVRAIVGLTVALVFAAVVGSGRGGRFYRRLCAAAVMAFLIASAAALQARLYQVGHERDPWAPIRAIRDFTPPLVGPVKVGNFTVWSYPHVGASLLLAAAALAIAGARLKPDTTYEPRAGRGDRGVRLSVSAKLRRTRRSLGEGGQADLSERDVA